MGKFAALADATVMDISALFNRSIRAALVAGLVTAIRTTRHDSSNAAVHWMVASDNGNRSRPWARKTGKINDFRGTKGGRGEEGPRAPVAPVGYRRDNGKNFTATLRFVRERELKEVINRLVQGRHPEGRFYFYHPLAEGMQSEDSGIDDLDLYQERAKIQEAGESAVAAVGQVFQRNILAGNVRKRR